MCLNVRSCTALASFVWSNRSPLHCNLENNLGAMQPYIPFYCDLFLWVLKLVFLNNRVSAWKGVCWHESAPQKENIKTRYKYSVWLQWRRQRVQYATKSVALKKTRKVVQKQSAQPRKQMLVYIVVYGIALALVLVPILFFIFVSFVLHFKTNQRQKWEIWKKHSRSICLLWAVLI